MSHTPGPWQWTGEHPKFYASITVPRPPEIADRLGSALRQTVAEAYSTGWAETEAENRRELQANARLIAAAPELAEALGPFAVFLGALEAAAANGESEPPADNTCIASLLWKGGSGWLFVRDLRRAAAALAKASGDTP